MTRPSISRVEMPRVGPTGYEPDFLGGQWEWVWAVPLPYGVLASAFLTGAMPAAPRVGGAHAQGLGYFASLQSFLTYSFAWTRHDRGLLWWYEAGMPTPDLRLQLLKHIWEQDGLLDRYLAWVIDRGIAQYMSNVYEPLRPWARDIDDRPERLSPAMASRVARARQAAEADDWSRNPWGMHLEGGDHIGAPSTASVSVSKTAGRIVSVEPAGRSATFVANRGAGWYRALYDEGSALPPLEGNASWYVDVYVKPIGYLGTYRRSRATGLWFSGQHRFHAVGN
jgi:hypothetical protein